GSRSSEGDITHLAYAARHAFNVNGTGIKIGVLSDGVTNLAASQAAGDLGPVTVLSGQTGSGDEGTAMLEIVHDLAPGAQLYFATAGNEGNLNDGTSGTWEGDFVDGGASAAPLTAGRLHNFGGQTYDVLTAVGSLANLYWADPLGGSVNDYDLFRLNSAGTL